jgi:hypothetical protein
VIETCLSLKGLITLAFPCAYAPSVCPRHTKSKPERRFVLAAETSLNCAMPHRSRAHCEASPGSRSCNSCFRSMLFDISHFRKMEKANAKIDSIFLELALRALIFGFVILVLLGTTVHAQQLSSGILNKWNTQDYPPLATSSTYSCHVRWFVDTPLRATLTATVTLMDSDRAIVLVSNQYQVPAGTRYEQITVLTATVPRQIGNWRLSVTLQVSGGLFFGNAPADSYDWSVDASRVPEFTQAGIIMLTSIILALVIVRRHLKLGK